MDDESISPAPLLVSLPVRHHCVRVVTSAAAALDPQSEFPIVTHNAVQQHPSLTDSRCIVTVTAAPVLLLLKLADRAVRSLVAHKQRLLLNVNGVRTPPSHSLTHSLTHTQSRLGTHTHSRIQTHTHTHSLIPSLCFTIISSSPALTLSSRRQQRQQHHHPLHHHRNNRIT